MRITRLSLTDFKAHRALEIVPAAGLTIIRGPNEAGKSSIQQAIELVLFRKADANRDDTRKAWAWGSSSAPLVELDFESEDGAGQLAKRFAGINGEGRLTFEGETVSDNTLIGDRLADLTGVPTEAFFRATASVGHTDLEVVAGDEPAIGDRLQKAISGADRGTGKAKKKLEEAVWRYRTEGHKNPGLLKVAREQVAELERDLAEGEGALARLQSDRAQWVEAHARREELEVKLRDQQADLAEVQRAASLTRQRDAAQDRYDRFKRAAELTIEAEELERGLPTTVPAAQLRTAVARLQNLEFELSELDATISLEAEVGAEDRPEITPPRPMRWLAAALAFIVAGWLATFLLEPGGLVDTLIMVALGTGVIVSLVAAVRGAGRRRQYGLAMELAEAARAQRSDADREQQDQSRRKRRELEAMLKQVGVPDVESAAAMLATTEESSQELARIDGELRGLGIERRGIRSLEDERDQAAGEAAQAGHALAAMGNLAEDPVAAEGVAKRLVAQTVPACDQARSEADQAQGRVDANPVDAELIAGLAERLTAARERQAELERRVAVYEGVLEAIEAAEQATLKTAARYLEDRMGPAISAITDGRYDDIEVDERSLAFRVRAPETGELVDVGQLSQGTADQLFLAARLGLVRLVTMDRRPPLILDDPFVTFDMARGERALRLVKRFAHEQGFQVLYLTSSDRFDDLADELVVLPAPSDDRVLAAPRGPLPVPTPAAAPASASEPEVPQATLSFDADSRPGPDPLAPLRQAVAEASEAERDTGISDPFRLAERDEDGAAD